MIKWQSERYREALEEKRPLMFYMIQTYLSENNRQNLPYPNKDVEQNGIKFRFTTKIRIVNYL